jgi:hypothetical protein
MTATLDGVTQASGRNRFGDPDSARAAAPGASGLLLEVAAIAELHRHVALLERVALEYRDAADLAAALAKATPC